jgi:hypothetical protein
MPLFRILTAQGQTLAIPPQAIMTLEKTPPGRSAQFPEAQGLLRFDLGEGAKVIWVGEPFEPLLDRWGAAYPPAARWPRLSVWEPGFKPMPLVFDPGLIQEVRGLDPTLPENNGAQAIVGLRGLGPALVRWPVFEAAESILGAMEAEEGPRPEMSFAPGPGLAPSPMGLHVDPSPRLPFEVIEGRARKPRKLIVRTRPKKGR